MPAAKDKAAPAGAADAAQAEAADETKVYEWRGIELELPAKLPGDLAFAYADLEASGESMGAIVSVVRSLVGEDNVRLVRNKIAEDGVALDEVNGVLAGLVNGAFALYGMAEGDSDASQKS